MLRFVVLFAFLAVAMVSAEDIEFSECGKDKSHNCGIKAVRLSPCPNVTKRNPCRIRKGQSGQLQFDFEPEFEADKLKADLTWVNNFMELPLPGMDHDGCHSTSCPTVAGQENHFSYNLTIMNYFPANKYNVKCLLKKDNGNECCFEFTIKIQ